MHVSGRTIAVPVTHQWCQANPVLQSPSAASVLRVQLCVLEDRLGRLTLLINDDSAQLQLLQVQSCCKPGALLLDCRVCDLPVSVWQWVF